MRDDSVRVLTAHRSKGLEWDVVVVAGVQEEVWPDLRLRGSLLGADELADATGATGAIGPCRAGLGSSAMSPSPRGRPGCWPRSWAGRSTSPPPAPWWLLVVTASGVATEQDKRPSRFLAELAEDDVEIERAGTATRWLALPALVADLRRTAADPGRPGPLRQAAAAQLARLAAAGVRGADPALVRADRAVRRRSGGRGRRAGPAVAVARGDLHPLRPALAA